MVKQTDATVRLPLAKSGVIVVRVITDRGKSAWSKPVKVLVDGNPTTATTNPSIDLVEQGGIVTVAAAQTVADSYRLVVRILPTDSNGGGQELARRYINVGHVGMMNAPDWVLTRGKANIYDQTVDLYYGSDSAVFSTRTFATQDMVLSTTAQLRSGAGYGIWLRASNSAAGQPTGLTFQYDKGWNSSFILSIWQDGKPCYPPIAVAKFPSEMAINGVHDLVVSSQGDTLFATIDGVKLFDVPSLRAVMAKNSCGFAPPTGTGVGLRVWGGGTSAVFTNTTVR